MPVEFPSALLDDKRRSSPRPTVWLALLVLFVAVGAGWTLLSWPEGQPTGVPWFWMRLLGYPMLAWAALFGIRLHFHEERGNRRQALHEVRQIDRQEAIAFGAEPLAVLGAVHVSAMGDSGAAARIVKHESVLQARTLTPRMPPIRHARLAFAAEQPVDRYRQAFQTLLAAIEAPLRALPIDVRCEVRLQLPADAEPERLLGVWKSCWRDSGLRPTEAALAPTETGLMALDEWLDAYGGQALEKFALFVAVQLHASPPPDSGEVAVAMLLGWAPLAERRDLTPIAMLHRPVACETDGLAGALETATLFGRSKPEEIHHLWHSGLSKADNVALLKSASAAALGAVQADGLTGVHDIDAALGRQGDAAAWSAAALAIDHVKHSNVAQLMACREHGLRVAVLAPVADRREPEKT